MIAPIQVHGNDLAATLAELKREGKYAWAWDVVGVAEYKLHINFERVAELADASVEGCNPSDSGPSRAVVGSIPTALTNLSGEKSSTLFGHINPRKATERERLKNVAVAVVIGEHTGNPNLPVPVLADKAQESNPVTGQNPFNAKAVTLEAGNSISIESRMDALRETLVSKGKIRPRREARKPYVDA